MLGLGHEVQEALLEWGIQPGGGLVEDEQIRIVHERRDDADLLPIALGHRADLLGQIEIQQLGEFGDALGGDRTAQIGQEGE